MEKKKQAHLLTVEEVAKRFGVDVSTVYRLLKSRKLPGIKIGSQWRFSEERLEQWLIEQENMK